MVLTIPVGHPACLRAGNTWSWRISFADYPVSEGWVLSYALYSTTSATQEPLSWDAAWVADDGTEFTVTIPTTTTDDFLAGSYRLTAFVTLASARYSPYNAPLLIEADSASLALGDGITHERKTWLAIKALIEGRAVADVESYSINGRALNRIPTDQLPRLEARYRDMVWRQEHPGKVLPGMVASFWSS